MLFKILSIKYGWFEVDFNRQFILTNSDFMGCDAPNLLLNALGNLLENKAVVQWLCWQDEPGAYLLKLERKGEQMIIEIYDTDRTSDELDYSGDCLEKDIQKLLYKLDHKMETFIDSVFQEFSLYENGNGRQCYQENWGDFPQEEYTRLQKLLKKGKPSNRYR